jgi:catechol 2,3-dioxygenase-like lactoylglutathione lyase family enzyme
MSPNDQQLPFLNNGVAQIAMVVKDLDVTVMHYYKHFGIAPWHFYTYKKPLVKRMSYHGKPASHSFRIALSYFGPTRIELIEAGQGDSVYKDFVEKHGYGVQHLGFLVEDMQKALEQAQQAGLEMIQDGSGFGPDGDGHYAYLDTEETLGITIELIQRPKRRHPPEKIFP